MRVCLVHHADSVGPDVDPQRPLSETGRLQADWLANHVKRIGFAPAAIWHSGKLRARQTAELFWRASNPLAAFSATRGLQPDDPPGWMRDRLAGEARAVMLVGHMPHLARLLHMLLRRPAGEAPDFPLHGCVALDTDGEDWKEIWRVI